MNTGAKSALSSTEAFQPATAPLRSRESPPTDPGALEAGLRHRVSAKVCSTHDLNSVGCSASQLHNDGKDNSYAKEREARISWCINGMLVNSSIIDNEFINSYSPFKLAASSWRLQPLRRKSTFVRWTVLYLAHFGRQWLVDCKTKSLSEDTWIGRRSNLAARVWATAALRMETECQSALSNPSSQSPSQGNGGATSFLDPCEWNKVTAAVDEQLFTKEYALKECFASGKGMPYNSPIIDSRDQPLPSHRLYRPLLKEAMESLPTRYYEEVEDMTTDHIEWFAVFLWVRRWGGCVPDETHPSTALSNELQPIVFKTTSSIPLSPTDTPVRVLQDQLGLDCSPVLDMCAFPFASRGYGRHLWENRSVLQVSARIDNWIALCVGRQTVFLLENEDELGPRGEVFENVHGEAPLKTTNSGENGCQDAATLHTSQDDTPVNPNTSDTNVHTTHGGAPSLVDQDEATAHTRSSAIVAFHKHLESKRLGYQLANPKPQHRHLELGLTFMGCVMETVRSGIAEALISTDDVSTWRPRIPDETVSFAISEQLRRCLGIVFFGSSLIPFDSTVRERLLWECQNGVQCSWQNKLIFGRFEGLPSRVPETVEAMMLCLLGFPSIHILSLNSVRQSDAPETDTTLNFQLLPVAGPQHLRINLAVDWSTSIMTAKICACEVVMSDGTSKVGSVFRWQDWRDAFEGRLIGKSEWQKNHSMRELQIRRTNASIWKGIRRMVIGEDDGDRPVPVFRRYLVWEGWKPFRAGMTLFELRHSSLIIFGDSMPTDTHSPTVGHLDSTSTDTDGTLQHQDTRQVGIDAYLRANMAALTDASTHLDALLTLDSNLLADTNEGTQDEDEDRAESQLVDLTPAPSSSSDGPSFRMAFNMNPPLPNVIMARAKEQDPIAMHILAKWVLTGTKRFEKNYTKALLLMERALVLGRNVKTARLLVKTLIDKTFMPDIPMDVDRARAAVELLWRDMAGRHEVVSIGNKKVRRWKGDTEAELARMSKLVSLHLKLVAARPTAEMMRNLADRLSTWGESKSDDELATVLYETAILANCDSKSILELGRKFHKRNPHFAAAMYQRALTVGQDTAAKPLADLLLSRKYDLKLSASDMAAVYERAAHLGHVGAMRELGLLLLRGEDGIVSDIVRGKVLADRAVYGDTVARALERGAVSLNIDSKQAEELRIAAENAFGGGADAGNAVPPAGRNVDGESHAPLISLTDADDR